jgi:UPF0755 protein
MKLLLNKYILSVFAFVLTPIIFLYIYIHQSFNEFPKVKIYIGKGCDFYQVSKILEEKRLINKHLFKIIATLKGYDKKIRTGEFELSENANTYQIIEQLISSKAILRKLTLIEGLQFKQLAKIMAKELELDSTKLLNLFIDSELINKIGTKNKNIEGYVLPQTYFLEKGITERELLNFLIDKNLEIKNKNTRILDSLKMTWNQLLTMASIVQAECNKNDEMSKVASVYFNRLNKNWKLQADPTVQYLLDKPKRLLLKDLAIKSAYNTYINFGLPPGPINNPGEMAINAALRPLKSSFMYFVADGTGYHKFGKTLLEHNKNRITLDLLRKKIK